jgi:hypothetical protein
MPLLLADKRIRLTALTVPPENLASITLEELAAGVELAGRVFKNGTRLSPTASDTVNEPLLNAEGNAVVYGASNYEAVVNIARYLTPEGLADPLNDVAWDTFREKGTHLWLVEREGPDESVSWAAAQEYEVYHVITDNPQKPSERTGYIKRTVPLGVQTAELNGVVAAGG